MHIRDRIKELRRVRAGDLRPNPRNWRTHPEAQRNALRGILAEVGFADALLVRELPDGRLELIDGHLRAETTPDLSVPVLVLDVNEEEAAKLLVTHDLLTEMAEVDACELRNLIASCQFASPEVTAMLAAVEEDLAKADAKLQDEQPEDKPIPESFQVVVECNSEEDQESVYTRLTEEGYQCRVLTL